MSTPQQPGQQPGGNFLPDYLNTVSGQGSPDQQLPTLGTPTPVTQPTPASAPGDGGGGGGGDAASGAQGPPPSVDDQIDQAVQTDGSVLSAMNADGGSGLARMMLGGLAETGGGGGGGHYALTPDELTSHIKELDGIIDESTTMLNQYQQPLQSLQMPPANDQNSVGQIKAAHQSITKAQAHLRNVINYGNAERAKWQASLDAYRKAEQGNADGFDNKA
ncbi:MAG: hypothetical protein ACRDRL_07005 [Sciscionella sp.]